MDAGATDSAAGAAAAAVYPASPINLRRHRSTKAEVERRREALRGIVAAMRPMTVRQPAATTAAPDAARDRLDRLAPLREEWRRRRATAQRTAP
jgi:hypothetical protein